MQRPTDSKRLLSLDVFRGITIAAMILVNNPVDWDYTYSQLRHATWNGWTVTDMIFPFFLFITGVSTTLSLARRRDQGAPQARLMLQIARRTVVLFALGVVLTNLPRFDWGHLRIPGVLQRIAVCYFFTAWIVLQSGYRGQLAWTAGLLGAYGLMLLFVPVPGIGAGVLEPGKSLPTYLDSLLLKDHLWSNYVPWDPEGIGSTIPAIASTLFGALAAQWLKTEHPGRSKTAGMLAAGLLLILLGRLLGVWLPINKGLWTSSYAVFMGGWALACFGTLHWLVDVKGHTHWAKPFAIYGKNAIAAYVLSVVLDALMTVIRLKGPTGRPIRLKIVVFDHFYAPLAGSKGSSLLYAISFVLVIYAMVWLMHRKGWFLKI